MGGALLSLNEYQTFGFVIGGVLVRPVFHFDVLSGPRRRSSHSNVCGGVSSGLEETKFQR